jgi:hypothetical protein
MRRNTTTAPGNTAIRIPVNVWYKYPFNRNDHYNTKIWTANELEETLYSKICSHNYVQLTSKNAPPTILSMLVNAFETETLNSDRALNQHWANVNINITSIDQLTSSRPHINITFSASWAWDSDGTTCTNDNLAAVFVPLLVKAVVKEFEDDIIKYVPSSQCYCP